MGAFEGIGLNRDFFPVKAGIVERILTRPLLRAGRAFGEFQANMRLGCRQLALVCDW